MQKRKMFKVPMLQLQNREDNWMEQTFPKTSGTVACVAGVRKGRWRELGRETTREGGGERVFFPPSSRAPSRFSRA